jgi:hypothetical protein
MRNVIVTSLILFAFVAASRNALAQSSSSGHHRHHQHEGHHGHRGYVVGGYFPGYGFGYGYGPGTVAGSYLQGRADLVRAYGEANYHNAAAQVYWEQAREKSIANRTAAVEQFFSLRSFNEGQRFAGISKSRLSKEQLIAMSKKAVPDRLGEENWNPATDGLAWPTALQDGRFDATRDRLDQLFRARRDSALGLVSEELSETRQIAAEMTEELKGMIGQLNPTDYAAAKRFLRSLVHEANFNPVSGERLARN